MVLFHTQTIFPHDLYPDSLTINSNHIEIMNAESLTTQQSKSIPLRDIAKIELIVTPFFATLNIINIRSPLHPITLQYLQIDKAIKAKKLIESLINQTE